MTRIRFEDLPSTDTPINATQLDKLNNVVISSTEPTTGEEVWIQKSKNLFDKNNGNILKAYFDASATVIKSHSNNRTLYISCEPNTTYTIQKYLSNQFSVGYTIELPAADVQTYNSTNGSRGDYNGTIVYKTITTGDDAKYLVLRYYNSANDTTVTEQEMLNSIQIERGSKSTSYEPYVDKKIYIKNDNGVYEEFYKEIDIETKTTIFDGRIMGEENVVLKGVKRYLDVYFAMFNTRGNLTGKYTIDTLQNYGDVLITYGSVVLIAHDSDKGIEYYISESCYDKSTGTFTHVRTGYFNISTGAYTSRNNTNGYRVYRIDTYN